MAEKLSINILSCFVVLAFAVCCTKDGDTESGRRHILQVGSVMTERMQTRSVIDGNVFPESDAVTGIGLYLRSSADSSSYAANGCSNVRYSNSGEGWSSDSPIALSEKEGILFSYFPYDVALSDLRRMPVSSSLNGKDYMYAVPVEGVSSVSENADIMMKHALARLSITFVKDSSYTGDGLLTSLSIEGEGIAKEGLLDLMTGSLEVEKAEAVSFDIPGGSAAGTIIPEGIVEECLIVPAFESDTLQDVDIRCIIDGKDYPLALQGLNGVVVCSGIQSNIVVKLNAKGLGVVSVRAGEWGEGSGGSALVDGLRNVIVKLEDESLKSDVLYAGYPEGTSMVIEALSKSGKVLLCNVPDNCNCTSTLDFETKVYKFTISDFKEDVTVVLGYPHDEGILARVEKDVTRVCAKKVFIDGGWRLDNGIPNNSPTKAFVMTTPSGIPKNDYVMTDENKYTFTSKDSLLVQYAYMGRDDVSTDGDLFWPDGETRYLVYYCLGGDASNGNEHGKALGNDVLERIRTFVNNGGSYLGSGGAGAAFAGEKLDGVSGPGYLGLYAGNVTGTGVDTSRNVTIKFPDGSPLLDYMGSVSSATVVDKYGVYVKDISDLPPGSEILARYADDTDCSNKNQIAAWAYKKDSTSGRIVLCGSKPESAYSGGTTDLKNRDKFLKAEFEYAVAGASKARIKSVIHNGETIFMQAGREDPEHCGIGGLQCHHFVIDVTRDSCDLTLNLAWPNKGAKLELYLRYEHFAIPDTEDYKFVDFDGTGATASCETTLSGLKKGLWYIAVRCSTTLDYYQGLFSTTDRGQGGVCYISSLASQKKKSERMASVCVPYTLSCRWK